MVRGKRNEFIYHRPSISSIPGYTFDVDKNRYFKIIPNNLAPEGSRFSAEEVMRRNKLLNAHRAPHPKKRLGDGVKLLREVGLSRQLMKESVMASWANVLESRPVIYASRLYPEGPAISQFVRDESTGMFLFTRGTREDEAQLIQ